MAPTSPSWLMATSFSIMLLIEASVTVVNKGCVNPVMTGKVPSAFAWAVNVPVKVLTTGVPPTISSVIM